MHQESRDPFCRDAADASFQLRFDYGIHFFLQQFSDSISRDTPSSIQSLQYFHLSHGSYSHFSHRYNDLHRADFPSSLKKDSKRRVMLAARKIKFCHVAALEQRLIGLADESAGEYRIIVPLVNKRFKSYTYYSLHEYSAVMTTSR